MSARLEGTVMHRMRRGSLIAGLFVWIAFGSQPSEGQYIADFQTNIISGVTSNRSGSYTVGDTNFASVLLIQNSGMLFNGAGILGNTAGSSNNSVSVTGLGSVWNNGAADLHVGQNGPGNRLVISNGGRLVDSTGYIYSGSGVTSNNVSVTGPARFGTIPVRWSLVRVRVVATAWSSAMADWLSAPMAFCSVPTTACWSAVRAPCGAIVTICTWARLVLGTAW